MSKNNTSNIPGTPSNSKKLLREAKSIMATCERSLISNHAQCARLIDQMVDDGAIPGYTYNVAVGILDSYFEDLQSFKGCITDIRTKSSNALLEYKDKVISKEELIVSATFIYDDAHRHIGEYAELAALDMNAFSALVNGANEGKSL